MVLMPPNLGVSFHYILNVVVRSIRLEYMSIPHGAPAPLMREQGHISNATHEHLKCGSVISLEYQQGIRLAEYLNYVHDFAVTQLGVHLTVPDDLKWSW